MLSYSKLSILSKVKVEVMKTLKRIGIWMGIYLLMSIGAVMAVQHSWWWMLPSAVSISLGLLLVEYYARNWKKFNE